MDDFNNNGGQGYDPNLYGQPSQGFNDQPNGGAQYGGAGNSYGGQPQYNQYNPNMNQPVESKGFSIASLICGVLSLISCFLNGWLVLILGICGIVFGIIGRKKGGKGMATAGLACGIASIVIFLLLVLLVMVAGVALLGSI